MDLFNVFTFREREQEKEVEVEEGISEKKNFNTLRKTKESHVTKAKKEECLMEGIVSALRYCRQT